MDNYLIVIMILTIRALNPLTLLTEKSTLHDAEREMWSLAHIAACYRMRNMEKLELTATS